MSVRTTLENLITSGIVFDEDSELKWRIVMINLIGIVAIANLIPLGIYSLIRGKLVLGIADNLLGIFFIFSMIMLRRGTGYAAIAYPSIYATAMLFLYLFFSGGFDGTGQTTAAPAVGDLIEISVSDTGIGIETKDIARVFDPFEQVESNTNRRYPGTGLGLALTRQFVELHGGGIRAESKGPDRGSAFIFTLPIEQSAPSAAALPEAERQVA